MDRNFQGGTVPRDSHLRRILDLLERSPIVVLLGARQVGKTTLARQVAERGAVPATFFDLEDPVDAARLEEPSLALRDLRGLVVLDEVQRRHDLFPLLRVLADRPGTPARFLLLGSASPLLVRNVSESLAGRAAFHELPGFDLDEVGPAQLQRLWLRGGFPRSFLAGSDRAAADWRADFVRTYLERDVPQLGLSIPAATLRRFWTMLAHVHGQVWNASALGRSLGVSDTTVGRYLDVLSGTYLARRLAPWHENLNKRQVKSPKVYLADPGLLHSLLGLETMEDLLSHPRLGASWEGFAIGLAAARLGARPQECHFWATHAGAELELLVVRGRRRLGFEVKRTDAPRVTPSMRVALADLGLERLDVLHAGDRTFPLADRIRAVSLARLREDVEPL